MAAESKSKSGTNMWGDEGERNPRQRFFDRYVMFGLVIGLLIGGLVGATIAGATGFLIGDVVGGLAGAGAGYMVKQAKTSRSSK
jgi:uncharacterized protein YcfJ